MAALRAAGHVVETHATTGPGTAGEIARKLIAGDADLILVAGGDGTINEALNGMVGSEIPLGALPAGTANVLGHELGLGNSPEGAAERLGEFEPVRVALGVLRPSGAGPRHFLMMAGVGLDARVVVEVDQKLKRRIGKFAYWAAALRLTGKRLAEFEVRSDGVIRRCGFALAARVRNYGGDLEIARGASLLAPDFEAVLLEGVTATRYLKYFAGVAAGTLKGMRGTAIVHARAFELTAPGGEPVPIQVDGEFAGHLPAAIEIADDALTLLVPPAYLASERLRVSLK